MRSYSETHVFGPREIGLLRAAEELVKVIPDRQCTSCGGPGTFDRSTRRCEECSGTGGYLRCHEVARAVGIVLALEVQDGKYFIHEHSWLWTSHVKRRTQILDVYAIGSLPQVRLVDPWCISHRHLYVPGAERTDIDTEVVAAVVNCLMASCAGTIQQALGLEY